MQPIPALLRANALRIHFQPIWSLDTGRPMGYEALTRGPEGTEWEAPLPLFRAAEEAGLLHELECHVRHLIVDAYPWGPRLPLLFINFNPQVPCDLVGVMPPKAQCAKRATCALRSVFHQFSDQIVLELPESLMIQNLVHAEPDLAQLRARGISLALDDFGSQYANFDMLLRIRPDWIKLDRVLIDNIHRDPWRQAIVRQLVGVQKEIGVTIIAEGVESADELTALRHLGVRFAQGFYLGRPLPHDRIRWPR